MWLVEILVDGQWQALIYSDDQGNWSHPNLRDMHAELRSAGYTTPAFISPFPGLSHCEIDVLHSADAWVLLPVYLGALLRVKARRSFGLCIVAAARVEEQAPALGSEPEETPEEPSSEAAEASPSRKRRKRRSQNSNSPESHE